MAIKAGKCLLAQILKERKIDHIKFYTDIGWSKQQYYVYSNKKRKMSIDTLKTVANALQLPMDDLYEWVEE
jgi:hypothetical protein